MNLAAALIIIQSVLIFPVLSYPWQLSSPFGIKQHSEQIALPPWHPPSEKDLRSPCPALNALANHNIIPRNGVNITAPQLRKGLADLGISKFLSKQLVQGGMKLGKFNSELGELSLNLDDLKKHNAIEHDASLSRQDYHFGDNVSFNMTVFSKVEPFLIKSANGDYLTKDGMAKWRNFLNTQCRQNNPECTLGLRQKILANGELSLVYLLLKDSKGRLPYPLLRDFFEYERLPDTRNRVDTLQLIANIGILGFKQFLKSLFG